MTGYKSQLGDLLTCVPDLHPHSASRFERNWLRGELDAYRRPFLLGQLALNIATEQVSLAHVCVAEEYYFEYKVVIVVVAGVHRRRISLIMLKMVVEVL